MISSKPRLLMIDDEPNFVRSLSMSLEDAGFQMMVAHSGKEGLPLAYEQHPDLVLLDIAMPELSGIETLELIRQRMELKALPVVFLTASTDTENIIRASELGVSDYICKPFMPDDLVGRVKNVLQANGMCLE